MTEPTPATVDRPKPININTAEAQLVDAYARRDWAQALDTATRLLAELSDTREQRTTARRDGRRLHSERKELEAERDNWRDRAYRAAKALASTRNLCSGGCISRWERGAAPD